MTSPARCWFCSEEIRATERARVVTDLNVLVHVACFDRLYETEGLRSWSAERRPPESPDSKKDDEPAAS